MVLDGKEVAKHKYPPSASLTEIIVPVSPAGSLSREKFMMLQIFWMIILEARILFSSMVGRTLRINSNTPFIDIGFFVIVRISCLLAVSGD